MLTLKQIVVQILPTKEFWINFFTNKYNKGNDYAKISEKISRIL
jgi:hypothetical protein